MYIDYEYSNKNKGLWPKGYVKKKRSKYRVSTHPINTNPQGMAISLCHHFKCNISYPLGKYVDIYKWESIELELFPPPHPERPFFFPWSRQQ